MNLHIKLIRLLVLALPGLLLAVCAEYLLQSASEVSKVAWHLGVDQPYGKYLGANPFLYHIAGLYLGLLFPLVLPRKSKACRKFWIATGIFIASGILMMFTT